MQTLLIIAVLLCAVTAQAAEVQIIVRNDASGEVVNTTITTTNDVLNILETWRLKHEDAYPDRASLFRAILVDQAKRIIRIEPTPELQAERDKAKCSQERSRVRHRVPLNTATVRRVGVRYRVAAAWTSSGVTAA